MIGFPGETVDQIQQTIDFAVNAPLDAIFISVVSPFKGTVLRDDMLNGRFGKVDSEPWSRSTSCSDRLQQGSFAGELTRMQRNAYFRFYTKPRSLLHLGKKLTNRRNVKRSFGPWCAASHNREMVSLN